MGYSTNTISMTQRSRGRSRAALQQVGLGIGGFLAGLVVMGGIWWLGVGPRQTLSLYWLTSPDNEIYYVEQERSFRALSLDQAIATSLKQLIAGSSDERLLSAIPSNTQILNVKVEGNDIFLNFSHEFTEGGGSTSMLGRVTQVLYTVTSQNDQSRVWLSVEGQALNVLGGEGLILDQPLTRQSFAPSFQQPIRLQEGSINQAFWPPASPSPEQDAFVYLREFTPSTPSRSQSTAPESDHP